MGKAIDDLETLELIGSTQWGLLTTSQAERAGVARVRLSRLADRGTLQRVRHGVYALPSSSGGPLQALRAAWLATDSRPIGRKPTAVVSGQSAAAVHGLGDYVPSSYEFTTPIRRQTTQKDVRYRVRDLPETDVERIDSLPVTTIARTVADLANSGPDLDHLAAVASDALRTGTSRHSLAAALESSATTLGYPNGQACLVGLLNKAGYEPDPEVATALHRYSEAVAQSFSPQMQRSMAKMIEQIARQSGLVTASLDSDVATRMLALMTPQTEAMRASIEESLTPEAIREISASAADMLGSVARIPRALSPQGREHDAERTESDRAGATANVAEREAGDGG